MKLKCACVGLLVVCLAVTGVRADMGPNYVYEEGAGWIEMSEQALVPFDPTAIPPPLDLTSTTSTGTTVSVQPNQFPDIRLFVSVLDNNGDSVTGLTQSAFTLWEQSSAESSAVQETITCFSEAVTPGGASFALVFDVSGSMSGSRLANAKIAAINFLNNCGADDRCSLVKFSGYDYVHLVKAANWVQTDADHDGTYDIVEAINSLSVVGGTAIYDGTGKGIQSMSQEPAPKAVIVFSDGQENSSRAYNINTVIAKANNEGVPLFTIGLGYNAACMKTMAQQTGGQYYYAPSAQDMTAIYNAIAKKLRSQYTLCYTSHNPDFDGTFRTVTVTPSGYSDGQGTYRVNDKPEIELSAETLALALTSQTSGGALTIAGTVTDADAASQNQPLVAMLYYRHSGTASFTMAELALTNHATGVYGFAGTIPGSAVLEPAVEYYVRASDGLLEVFSPFNYTVVPHVIPVLQNHAPVITHTPVTTATEAQAVTISADVVDNDGGDSVSSVTLYYAVHDPSQDMPYYPVSLSNTTGNTYIGQIPAGKVTPAGLDYFISARDSYQVRADKGSSSNPYFIQVLPYADFGAGPLSGVLPLTVTFTNLSSGTIDSCSWDFDGDGAWDTNTCATTIAITFTNAGTYTVTLRVEGPGGSVDVTKPGLFTIIPPPPVALFSAGPLSGEYPLTVTFTNESSGSITNCAWDFDLDGNIDLYSTDATVTHTYNSAGAQSVRLIVYGSGGENDSYRFGYVTVEYPPPVADFVGSPLTGSFPLDVTFTNLSSGAITNCAWDFDDPSGVDTNTMDAALICRYESAGAYTVTLTVTGPGGSDSKTRTGYVQVTPPAPVCDFSASPTSGAQPLTVTFTDLSTGSITNWNWDFNNDSVVDAINPVAPVQYTYNTTGTYSVALTVYGPGGSDSTTKSAHITVNLPAPTAEFDALGGSAGVAPLTVTFTNESSGVFTNCAWDFDNDSVVDDNTTAGTVTHIYPAAGTYTVKLTAQGPGGAHARMRGNFVTVYPAPTAAFSGTPTSGTAPLTVTFTDTSTGFLTTRTWDFDNDSTPDAVNPVAPIRHTYTAAGVYTVKLTVDGVGGSDDEIKAGYVTVNEPPPTAAFCVNTVTGNAPLEVTFTDLSTGSIATREWDFDNNGSVDATDPGTSFQHTYTTSGVYSVKLTVTGPGGSDSEIKTDYVSTMMTNRPPVVGVMEQVIYLGGLADVAVLDATPSSDPDGDQLFYSWREWHQNPHRGLLPVNADGMPKIGIQFPSPGRYYFTLQVSDGIDVSENVLPIDVYVPGLKGVVNFAPTDTVRVPDAYVCAYTSSTDAASDTNIYDLTITDSRGRYILDHLRPAETNLGQSYWMKVHRGGFETSTVQQVQILPNPNFDENGLDFLLGRGILSDLQGYIYDTNNNPINMANVSIIPAIGGSVYACDTDLSGYWHLSNVEKGSWLMQLLATGYQPEVRDLCIDEETTNIVMHMQPLVEYGSLTGKVVLIGTEFPIPNARVLLGETGEQWTDAEGNYAFQTIACGTYIMQVKKTGYEDVRYPSVQVKPGTRVLDVPISAKGTIVLGMITDAISHKPIPKATIGIELTPDRMPYTDVTDWCGYYEIRDVPTGSNRSFKVSAPNYQTRKFPLHVLNSLQLDVELSRTLSWVEPQKPGPMVPEARVAEPFIFVTNMLANVVLDASPSVGDELIYMWRESPDNPKSGVLPGAASELLTNQVEVSGFSRPGIYIFTLQVRNSRISENTAAVTVFAPGLSGSVHTSPSDGLYGLYSAEVRVYTDYQKAMSWDADGIVEQVQSHNTHDDVWIGDFFFETLTTGSYWLVTQPLAGTGYNQYGPVRRFVNYSAAMREHPVNMPRDEVALYGRICDANTQAPLENARILVAPGNFSEMFRTSTDAQGNYRLTSIPEGSQWIVLFKEGYQAQMVNKDIYQNPQYIEFGLVPASTKADELATVEGQITAVCSVGGEDIQCPVPHAEVMLAGVATTFTDGDGYFRIDGLPAGRYYGIIRREGFRSQLLDQGPNGVFELAAGQTKLENRVLPLLGAGPSMDVVLITANNQQIQSAGVSVGGLGSLMSGPKPDGYGTSDTGTGTVLTDAGGIAQLNGVPYGEQVIVVTLEDGREIERTVNVIGSGRVVLDVTEPESPQTFGEWATNNFVGADLADTNICGEAADPDADGYNNEQEFIIGSRPKDPGSAFLPGIDKIGFDGWQFTVDNTLTDRVYDVWWCTNLVEGNWQKVNLDRTGTGGEITLTVTNDPSARPNCFYSTGVTRP
ncbi:MAG: VWA domain-containing protein [Kiritimatiellae bacterium]|nr:VWA domain-containing protein [Kiritimatiellia bacterium]